ncbi:P-selectin glycoprotein ligand 1 [Erythrolamprus reginae]|uniref:P-selectin glycoprotein ligand 1 n=1 Tax=Erythrolamprus reginae TaxID=121349 RepID=UPI00396CABF9
MASWWIVCPLVLSSILPSGDFKSIQDGTSVTPVHMNDWKWKATAEGSNSSSELLRKGGQDPEKKPAKVPPALPTASGPSELLQKVTFPMKVVTKHPPKKALPEGKSETKPKPLPREVTVTWPWLLEVTSEPSRELLSTETLKQDLESPGPLSTGKDGRHSSSKKVTPTLASLDDLSTASSHDRIEDSGASTATQEHIPPSTKKDTKSKPKLPLVAATSAPPQHLDEIFSTSQALVEDTEFSTAAQKHKLDSRGPGLNPRAGPVLPMATSEPRETQKWLEEMESTSAASSTRSPRQNLRVTTLSGSLATAQKERPSANDPSPLLGKCLLAILLLALVAAIFIVCSGVLATLLWRQKRAYRLGQANHTEMVCISSLLSAEKEEEEEEERRRRQPKVKRVQLLGETASETEADNLTLNSFLPEH